MEMLFELLPGGGSILKTDVVKALQCLGIGEKKARAFITGALHPRGPIFEWRLKRAGKRDEIHLSRQPQPDVES